MTKITFFKMMLLAICMVGSVNVFGQSESVIYTCGFESAEGFTASTVYNNSTIAYTGASGKQWGTYFGTPSTTSPITGLQSMQMRWYTTTPSSNGYTFTNFDLANVTKVTFSAKNTTGINVIVSYSTDGGSNYTGAQTFTLSTSASTYTYNVSATGEYANVRLKFQLTYSTTPTTTSRLYIDDISVYGMTTIAATPTFDPVEGTYTSAQNVTISNGSGTDKIYYTTDGSDPSSASTLYTAPINVSTTTTIKAIAYDQNDANPSSIASATYTIDLTPTITVTETSIPAMTAEVGASDAETIHVSGINLTDNITLAITGTDAAQFSVDPTSITQTGGTASSTAVTVTYTPTAAGSHSALLEISSPGATTVTRDLTGTASLAKPEVPIQLPQSDVTQTSFKASWNAVSGATSYDLSVYTKATTGSVTATDLFFSEYVEGSGSNKYLEIYNGTGADVNLSNYKVEVYPNGGTSATYTQTLSGTLANANVYVIGNSSGTIYTSSDITSTVTYYNGNDAVALIKISTGDTLDIIGKIGEDPGSNWTAGTLATSEQTLVRKSTVTGGVTTNPTSGFPTLSTEWDGYAQDDATHLGAHTLDDQLMTVDTDISGSPFTGLTTTSKTITGLSNSNTYYYTVVAKDGVNSSPVSDEVTVNLLSTGLNTAKELTGISASNGKIRFSAGAGENIQVFNAVGQRIVNKVASEGLNEITVSAKGIMIVKVGSKTAKVVL